MAPSSQPKRRMGQALVSPTPEAMLLLAGASGKKTLGGIGTVGVRTLTWEANDGGLARRSSRSTSARGQLGPIVPSARKETAARSLCLPGAARWSCLDGAERTRPRERGRSRGAQVGATRARDGAGGAGRGASRGPGREEGLPGQECAWERAQPARRPEESSPGAQPRPSAGTGPAPAG